MKLCSECKWSEDLGGTVVHPRSIWVCGNEQVGSHIDVVDGKRVYVKCHEARSASPDSQCGIDGKLWEARP